MKSRNANVVTHSGNLNPQETQRMSIDENSLAHLMSILTDLYSDPALAVIREYSTNAWDSHRAAGHSDPIEIELPTYDNPTFVVRDHGVGMSHDELIDQFSKYGFSSKRDTNNEVGLLGLGCKSGLTYTNQFALTAVKDNHKTAVVVSREETGTGVLQIVNQSYTTESNGVEIKIPVTNVGTFTEKAEQFFRFWDPGTVLVDGKPVESFFDRSANWDMLFLDDDVFIGAGLRSDYVVMGGIAYPTTDMQFKNPHRVSYEPPRNSSRWHVVVRVEIGSVDFTPSREALHMTNRTTELLKTMGEFVVQRTGPALQEMIDAQSTRHDAMRRLVRWNNLLPEYLVGDRPTYRGEEMPLLMSTKGQVWTPGRTQASSFTSIHARELFTAPDKVAILTGHPARSMLQETKVAIQTKYPDIGRLYVPHDLDPDHARWLTGVKQIRFEDVKPARPSGPRRRSSTVTADKGEWLVLDYSTDKWVSKDGWQFRPDVAYIFKSDTGGNTKEAFRRRTMDTIYKAIPSYDSSTAGLTLVLIGRQEVNQLTRAFPNATHVTDYLGKKYDEMVATLTDDELTWNAYSSSTMHRINPDNILDPTFAALARRAQNTQGSHVDTTKRRLREISVFFSTTGYDPTYKARPSKVTLAQEVERLLQSYPLLDGRNHDIRVIEEYINATYTYRNSQRATA